MDRKNATVHNVTVDNVTIAITEYRLKPKKEKKEAGGSKATEGMSSSHNSSKAGEGASNHSDAESDSMEPSGQDRSS